MARAMEAQSPFDVLVDLDAQCREGDAARVLNEQSTEEAQWSGIAVRVGRLQLLCELSEISEVLTCPPPTRIPGTKRWMKGLANIRGTVFTIVDLRAFLGYGYVTANAASRVLIIRSGRLNTGLLVDQVLGRFQIGESKIAPGGVGVPNPLTPYVSRQCSRDDSTWWFFSLRKLIANPGFMDILVEQHAQPQS